MAKGKSAWAGLKLDMKKACDILEWDFLFECLKWLGFHDQWIRWIRECVTMMSYSMPSNTPHELFKPSRGKGKGTPCYRIYSFSA